MPNISVKMDVANAISKLKKYDLIKIEQTKKALKEAAINTERKAKKFVPVDTGRLRSSIRILHARFDQLGFEVGTDVEYAASVEFGIKQKPSPYLHPAFELAKHELIPKLSSIFKRP